MKIPWQQEVVELGRGRVQYRIALWMVEGAFATHEGYRLSEHFAAERAFGAWCMTHLPSGLHVTGATRKTLKASRDVARQLERCGCRWDRFHRYSRRTKQRTLHQLVARGVLQPLQVVG